MNQAAGAGPEDFIPDLRWEFAPGVEPGAWCGEVAARCRGAGPESTGRVRSTQRLEQSDRVLGIKQFRLTVARRLAAAWWPSPARREWQVASLLQAAGVEVPRMEALAFSLGSRVEILVYRWRDDVRDLGAGFDSLGPKERRLLARNLARALRAMHETGVEHRDLHAGNVLFGGDLRVVVTDFHRSRRRQHLALHHRLHDLLLFSHFFRHRARPSERLRFLKEYGGVLWPPDRRERRCRLRDWSDRATRSLLRFLDHHDRRCLGSGRAFQGLEGHGLCGVRGAASDLNSLRRFLQSPDAALSSSKLLHSSPRGTVHLWQPFDGGAAIVVKSYTEPLLIGVLRTWFARSRARRAWLNAFRLQSIGIRVPRMLAFLQPRRSPTRASYLLYEFVEDAPMLTRWLERRASTPGDTSGRDLLHLPLQQVVADVARAHDFHLANRDLKAENLLVAEHDAALVWIDFDGLRRVRQLSMGVVSRDLMRLNASFRDFTRLPVRARLRYLRAYRHLRHSANVPFRELAEEIRDKTLAKWKQAPRRPRFFSF